MIRLSIVPFKFIILYNKNCKQYFLYFLKTNFARTPETHDMPTWVNIVNFFLIGVAATCKGRDNQRMQIVLHSRSILSSTLSFLRTLSPFSLLHLIKVTCNLLLSGS